VGGLGREEVRVRVRGGPHILFGVGFVNPPQPPILNVGKQEQLEDVPNRMQSHLRPGWNLIGKERHIKCSGSTSLLMNLLRTRWS
jgi:hypothetical protein